MDKTNKIGVYVGRFQPLHKGHFETIKRALASVDKLIILVGSSGIPRNPKNPFTFLERSWMIYNSVKHYLGSHAADTRLIIEPLVDNL
jgi:bifunctional NMN adenylyltransferase/nudix hydrolase